MLSIFVKLSTAKNLKEKIAVLGEYTNINTTEMNQMAASVLTSIETIKDRASYEIFGTLLAKLIYSNYSYIDLNYC